MQKRENLQYYKPELKEPFIEEESKNITKESLQNYSYLLKNLSKYEFMINTDLADFTKRNWKDAWTYFANKTTIISGKTKLSQFVTVATSYIEYREKSGNNVAFKEYKSLMDLVEELGIFQLAIKNRANSIITREELFKKLLTNDKIRNFRDKAVVALMFDGVCGSRMKFVIRVREGNEYIDYDRNKVSISEIGKKKVDFRTATSETMYYVRKASEQETYFISPKNPNEPLPRTGYLIRASGKDKTGIIRPNVFYNAFTSMTDRTKFGKKINTNNLLLSGIVNCILYAEKIYESTPFDYIELHKKLWRYYSGKKISYDTLQNNVAAFNAFKQYYNKDIKLDLTIIDEMKTILKTVFEIELNPSEKQMQLKDEDTDSDVFFEGNLKFKNHYLRERNPSLIKEAKKAWLKNHKYLECRACGCIPSDKYGESGNSAIEGHHKIPLHEFDEGKDMHIEDILLICANCHSIIHQKKTVTLTLVELQELLNRIRKNK